MGTGEGRIRGIMYTSRCGITAARVTLVSLCIAGIALAGNRFNKWGAKVQKKVFEVNLTNKYRPICRSVKV
jgi:hypothetical protein